jgi:predicted Ser/Thr protein kinase
MTENQTCPRCGSELPPGTAPEMCPRCLMRRGFGSTGAGVVVTGASEREPPPAIEEVAALFPQLEILEVLGRGGMGVVYKARQKSLDRIVALKVLSVGEEAGAAFAERFAREARALASLNHPSIVAVHDSGVAGGRYYLVMEYVDGTDLRRMIRAGRIAPREALVIVSQVCGALQYAHDQGVVHRDIKPENILVDRSGRVRIADFGLAKLLGRAASGEALTGPHQAMGTPHYMAPEQLERPLEVDHRADIYSLGVVFYELLTGELPLGRFAPPSQRIEVDVRVDEVVLKALEKDLPRRYQHASEVKTRVDDISSSPGRGAAAGGGAHRRIGRERWHVALAGALTAAFLLIGPGLFWLLWIRPGRDVSVAGLLLLALMALCGMLSGIALVALLVGRARAGRAESGGAPRPAWPWVLGLVLLSILLVPFGCAALGALFLAKRAGAEHVAVREAQLASGSHEVAAGLEQLDQTPSSAAREAIVDALIARPELAEGDRRALIGALARIGGDDPRWAAEALIRLVDRGREAGAAARALTETEQLLVVDAVLAMGHDADAAKVLGRLLSGQRTTATVRERIRAALEGFDAEQASRLREELSAAER